jgi:DNA-binding GntR family transcriptional regulator
MAKNYSSPKLPLAAQAYRVMQDKIITMDFEPGQHLDEKQLVSQLGIGRTPIREAMLRLASESLVETQPNKGFIVRPLMVQNIKAMFEALRIIEIGTASLAVHQDPTKHLPLMQEAHQAVEMAIEANDLLSLVWANYNFHMHFAQCSTNDYLVRALRDVRNEANRLAYLSYSSKDGLNGDLLEHYQSVCREHKQIMDYLKNKELDLLKETIEEHIRTFQQRVILYLTASSI